jgi:site-specific recombinase XerD
MARRRSDLFEVVPSTGPPGWWLQTTAGELVVPVDDFLTTLAAGDASGATIRSYAYDLLRWWRWLTATGVTWDRAERIHVRDFVTWMRSSRPGGAGLKSATINHCLAVLSSFYVEHARVGTGPARSPVPVQGNGRERRHRSPMEPHHNGRRAPLRQRVPATVSRGLRDDQFDALFATMLCDRDRALLCMFASTGARASELLDLTVERVNWGEQVVGVERKGSRRLQWLVASPDAFVWLRLYVEHQVREPGQRAVWLTERQPWRPLSYMAARRVLQRANERLGTVWTWHDLRHTAARRMIADEHLTLIDVQRVLGHAHLSTTQRYVEAIDDEVIARMIVHHGSERKRPVPVPSPKYSASSLSTLFGWKDATTDGR